MMSANTRRVLVLGCWVLALALAFYLDRWAARFAEPFVLDLKHGKVAHELKEFGHFGYTLFIAAFVWILHPSSWRGASMLCTGGIIAGVANPIVKWMTGR